VDQVSGHSTGTIIEKTTSVEPVAKEKPEKKKVVVILEAVPAQASPNQKLQAPRKVESKSFSETLQVQARLAMDRRGIGRGMHLLQDFYVLQALRKLRGT